jgi:hypothetical protein
VATATESLLTPEAKPPARRRRYFHRRYRKLILAARILLGVAAVVGLPAISHFAYNAFSTANCYNEITDDVGYTTQVAVQSRECAGVIANADDYMRLDASAAMLGVAFLLSSVACYRKARRYRPRAPIRPPRQP